MPTIPIIDIFAGPGGLGEGFSQFRHQGRKTFQIHLSIENDENAHRTLKLRSFLRSFPKKAPAQYYRLMRQECTCEQLYADWPENHAIAEERAWKTTLGKTPDSQIDSRIEKALCGAKEWVLVGGPPCQAYSVVGRSRNGGIKAKDPKVGLYKEYLRLVAKFNPTVFVMENVRGLLSANLDGSIFERILKDLGDPGAATGLKGCPGYRIHSFVQHENGRDLEGNPIHAPEDYLIRCEEYGIPQARHRVILLGIRKDVETRPVPLRKSHHQITVADVIGELPKLRSGISKNTESFDEWLTAIRAVRSDLQHSGKRHPAEVHSAIHRMLDEITDRRCGLGNEFVKAETKHPKAYAEWFIDDQIGGVANHSSRKHIAADLRRYFYAACYAKALGISPKLVDFPRTLLPNHKNVQGDGADAAFSDRFRVQMSDRPATTITSHISKDGHYFIHFDPSQCRSLTVREAARIQTFPDDYLFCGGRTSQYVQVGNAVPPLLAKRLASVVWQIMETVE